MKKFLLIIFCTIFFPLSAFSATLKEALKQTFDNNLELQAERKNLEIQQEVINMSRSDLFPSLTLTGKKNFEETLETLAFFQWAERFENHLGKWGAIDNSQLMDYVCESIEKGDIKLASKIYFKGLRLKKVQKAFRLKESKINFFPFMEKEWKASFF